MRHGEATTAPSGVGLGRRISAVAVMVTLGVIASVVIVPALIAVAVSRRTGSVPPFNPEYDLPTAEADAVDTAEDTAVDSADLIRAVDISLEDAHLALVTPITSARSARVPSGRPAAIAL